MRHGNSYDTPLDQTTQVTKMSGVAKNPGEENKWYSTDFKVAYDPCTCTYPSRLSLQFNWFSETDFVLSGRQITLIEPLTDAVNKELIDKDFLGAFEYDSDLEKPENGYIIYNSLEKAVDDYLAQMDKYKTELELVNANNAKIKRNIAIVKAFKAVILAGISPTSLVVAGVSITAALSGGADWATDLVNNASDLIKKDTIQFYTLKDETKKLLGAQFDFFGSKYFKEKPAPTKPSQPMVSYSEMSFKGKLSNAFEIPGPDFKVPGTFKNDASLPIEPLDYPYVYKLPIYNEVLGTFALLETPKFKISSDIQDQYSKSIKYVALPNQIAALPAVYQSWTENIQIKLENDLKFALNSTLDIKSYNIELALEVKDSITERRNNDLTTPIDDFQYCFTDPKYTTNLTSMSSDVNSIENIYNTYDFYNGNEFNVSPPNSIWMPFHSVDPTKIPTFKKRVRNFRSEFIPKDAFFESVFEFGVKNERISPIGTLSLVIPEEYGFKSRIDLELKIIVEIEFNTLDENGENNKIIETYTYKIPASNLSYITQDIFPNLSSSNFNLDFPKNLNFNNVVFNGANVSGCTLNGNSYSCKAIETISLNGNISTTSNYNVNFISGKEIVEYPECIIDGEIIREIQPFYNFSHPMPQVKTTYIENYCNSNNSNSPYKANISYKESYDKPQFIEEFENVNLDVNWDFSIYPNPTTSTSAIFLYSNNETSYRIEISDMMGKVVYIGKNKDLSRLTNLQLSDLSKGVYFIKVNTYFGSKTKQLIIQ